MESFDDYNYRGENLGYIGGYIDGQGYPKKLMNPEISFQVDFSRAYDILENHIHKNDFEKLRNNIDIFQNRLFKNPALILLSFIAVRKSKKDIDPQVVKAVYSGLKEEAIKQLIKENGISQCDILRYSRYLIQYGNFLF